MGPRLSSSPGRDGAGHMRSSSCIARLGDGDGGGCGEEDATDAGGGGIGGGGEAWRPSGSLRAASAPAREPPAIAAPRMGGRVRPAPSSVAPGGWGGGDTRICASRWGRNW